ncbi:hypothetical protein DFQ05_2600 [Winogradskyella wandonensis]|uniref:Uncharacterized protein n=2 Tax=Winogradskyella wandonensis TaxID=1442586 RepID=A0A4V2PT26_9FLAO|nr:hypothetical protein DFQ05_2600 [Winogradskyella wandonensis]
MDMKVGIVCKLTNSIADFEDECKDYTIDNDAVASINNEDTLEHTEVLGKISNEHLEKFRAEQNLKAGIFASILVGVIAALGWAAITVMTELQIGIVAIAIGAAVGLTMRFIGKGIDQVFGISGAIIALLSCVLGNFLSILGFIANQYELGYLETLLSFDYSMTFAIMSETASPMDLVFYAIAGYEGYKFSFRAFTERDIHDLAHKDSNR